jgi:hypothetical protein
MAKLDYHEGDWFAVPLGQGGYALGIIARTSQLGVLLGYFFGPRRAELPTLDDVTGLRPDAAVWITRFTDHGLRGRRRSGIVWPILGRLDDWDRSAWPLPVFARLDSRTGHAFRVYYGGDDPGSRPRWEQVPSDAPTMYRDAWGHTVNAILGMPDDGLASADHAEEWLDDLLSTG